MRMRTATVGLAFGLVFGAGLALADDSVIGYWNFDDATNPGRDASGQGGDITDLGTAANAEILQDAVRGGYLNLTKSGSTCGRVHATTAKGINLKRSTNDGWTIGMWVKGSDALANALDPDGKATGGDASVFKDALKDGKWHPLVIVYRPSNGDSYYRIYVNAFSPSATRDVCTNQDGKGNPKWFLPVTTSGGDYKSVEIGGTIGGEGRALIKTITLKTDFFGGIDDCIIIDRELKGGYQQGNGEGDNRPDDEVFRWVQTGETAVFSANWGTAEATDGTGADTFSGAGSANNFWSNKLAPQSGLDYQVENSKTVTANASATFAGHSLRLGRTAELKGVKTLDAAQTGTKTAVSTKPASDSMVGNLTQFGANTALAVADLQLNRGILESKASGQSLNGAIAVNSTAGNPYTVKVGSGTYAITGTMGGGGWIQKTGAGSLDLSGLTALDASVRFVNGVTLKLPSAGKTVALTRENTTLEYGASATLESIEVEGFADQTVFTAMPIVKVASGTLTVADSIAGGGRFAKTGPGGLDLSGLETFEGSLLLANGELRLPSANPTVAVYQGGTLVIAFDEEQGTARTVTIGEFSASAGTVKFRMDGTLTTMHRYEILRMPAGAEVDLENSSACSDTMSLRLKSVVSGDVRIVYLDCLPKLIGDAYASPMLILE